MKEDDIDVSTHTSNHINEYNHIYLDFIITVCDNANENCPIFLSKAKKFYHNFPDPAKTVGTDHEIAAEFRTARLSIKEYSQNFVVENL